MLLILTKHYQKIEQIELDAKIYEIFHHDGATLDVQRHALVYRRTLQLDFRALWEWFWFEAVLNGRKFDLFLAGGQYILGRLDRKGAGAGVSWTADKKGRYRVMGWGHRAGAMAIERRVSRWRSQGSPGFRENGRGYRLSIESRRPARLGIRRSWSLPAGAVNLKLQLP